MILVWSDNAAKNLWSIVEYIAKDNVKNAGVVYDRIMADVRRLVDFPQSGAMPKSKLLMRKGYRMLIVEKFLIFYLIEKESVQITAVIHGAQKYDRLIK